MTTSRNPIHPSVRGASTHARGVDRGTPQGIAGWRLFALVVAVWVLAFEGPAVVHHLGTPLSDQAMVLGAATIQSALAFAAGWLILRTVPTMRGRGRTAWTCIGAGMAAYFVASVGWTAATSVQGHQADSLLWDGVFLVSNLCVLAGLVALPPSANRSAPVRNIDTAIMMVAAACVLWALPVSSLLQRVDEATGNPTAETSAGLYAALNVVVLLLAMGTLARCRPDVRGEIRPTVVAVVCASIGDLVFAVAPLGGYSEMARAADAFYVVGLVCTVVAAHRLTGPPMVAPPRGDGATGRRRRDRPAVAELATLGALVALAVHQQVYRAFSIVTILLGAALISLAIVRLAQLELEQRTLTRSLRDTADRLYHEARTDALTGLGNRLGLDARLRAGLAEAARVPEAPGVSLFYIDIDHFKRINDGLGHHVGDELLVAVARRLVHTTGSDVYRVGGDEFVAVRTDLDRERAEALADAVVRALEPVFTIEDLELVVTASIGLARSEVRVDGLDRSADTPGAMLQRADLALYRAKELGRARWARYEPSLQARADERLELQQGLDLAIERREMELHHQPVVELSTGATVGLVCTLRWRSPRHGLLDADAFLPAAIEGGLLRALDDVLLDEVAPTCRTVATSDRPDLWVAFDLSRAEVVHPGLVERVVETLRVVDAAPGALRVRVSEDTIVDETALGVVRQLSDAGVHLTVTGFGTGPSSLIQLSHYPASTIEVDASFVEGLGRRRDDTIIVHAVAGLTSDLGLELAAGGIHEDLQVRMLVDAGCAYGTGRRFGEPVTRAQLVDTWSEPQRWTDGTAHTTEPDELDLDAVRRLDPATAEGRS